MASTTKKWQIKGSTLTQQALAGGGKFGSSLLAYSGYYGAYSQAGISQNIVGDVTIEFWLYYGPAAWRGSWRGVFGQWVNVPGVISLMVGATQTIFRSGATEMYPSGTPGTRWTDGLAQGWHHMALVRSGTTWNVYVDGTVRITGTEPNPTTPLNAQYFVLFDDPTNPYNSGTGWMSEFRVTKMARYTSNFTAPTAAFTLAGDPNASLVECLLHFDNTDTFDATTRNPFKTVGGVSLSNSIYKFGSHALQFDGTTGYMYSPVSTDFMMNAAGGFTIDCWVYVTGQGGVICQHNAGQYMFLLGLQNGSTFASRGLIPEFGIMLNGTWTWLTDGTTQVTQNAWNHIEVDYDGTNGYLFLNGTLLKSVAMTVANLDTASALNFGTNSGASPLWMFQGLIDELCITQGVARHTANFTPNTAAYDLTSDPYKNNIVCLLHMETLPVVYPLGQPITDQVDIYGGIPIVSSLISPISTSTDLSIPGFSLSDAGNGALGEYNTSATHIGYGNAAFQPDSNDTRTQIQQATDPNSFGGFVAGTCVDNASPLNGVMVDLMRNADYQPYSKMTTGADGTFVFHDVQLVPYTGYYLISANPNPIILDQNAQVYSQMTATPYAITTTGSFTIGSGTTINSTVAIVGNMGPFAVTLASGTLPPSATIQVNGRNIALVGASSVDPNGYVFYLNITGALRQYSSVIRFELTAASVKPMGQVTFYDGSWMGCTTPVTGSPWTGTGGPVLFKQTPVNRNALLHFDGTAGSSAIVDAMGTPWAGGPITLSATQSRFGGVSWNGTTGAGAQTYIYIGSYNWPPANNVPWTVQFWFYVTSSSPNWQHLYGPYSTPNDSSVYVNGTNFYVYINGVQQTSVPITLGTWYFCVDQWDGVTRTTALNGSVVYTSNLNFNGRNELMLNFNQNWSSTGGIFMDEFSMVNGHALYGPSADVYTSGTSIPFSTVPSAEFGTTFTALTAW